MLKQLLMRGVVFMMGLLFVLPMTAQAQEAQNQKALKPVLTLKVASPEILMGVVEKIADLAGQKAEFQTQVASFKDLKGLNVKNPIGFVLRSDGEEFKEPVLVLPVEDFDAIQIPGFEMIRGQLKKAGEGKYLLNSPAGIFVVQKKKGFYVVTPEDSEVPVPDDPTTLFADLEKYTIGVKVDFENTSFEAFEYFMAPLQFAMAMQGGPQAVQMVENLNQQIQTLHKEYASTTIGITFDPKTADLAFETQVVPRKGTDSEKQAALFKDAKTAFSAFRGGENTVFSCNLVDFVSETEIELSLGSFDQFVEGFLEHAETDEDYEFGEIVAESARIIFESILEKKKVDGACSLDAEGILLGALSLADTAELKKLTTLLMDRVKKDHDADEFDAFMKDNLKKAYETVEGYSLSSLTIPVAEAAAAHGCPVDLNDLTVFLYWGVKEGDSVAFAVGTDAAKTEARFKKALAGTKNPVPVQQPSFVFSLHSLGALLVNFEKIAPEACTNPMWPKIVNSLNAAKPTAKITGSLQVEGENCLSGTLKIDGNAVSVLAKLLLIAWENMPSDAGTLDRTKIREF